jgi:hypothetical protein
VKKHKKLKVFGGILYLQGGEHRAIIATSSQKKAAEIVGVSLWSFRKYWTETGNKKELEAALSEPEVVLVSKGFISGSVFKRIDI